MQITPDTTLQDVFSPCCLCVQPCHSADQMVCWHSMDDANSGGGADLFCVEVG